MTHYYEIYAGGVITGELVISTMKEPDDDGNVIMTRDEYKDAFSRVGRERRWAENYHEDYDVTSSENVVVLHTLPYDNPNVQKHFSA